PLPHQSWRPPPAPPLQEGEIHLWLAPLDPPERRLSALAETLCPEERQRAARFYFPEHRRRFTAARRTRRSILGGSAPLAPPELEFCYGPMGKPSLAESCRPGALRFNLSHSGELALYAVTLGRELGVDIEQERPLSDMEAMARSVFAPAE